MSDGPTLAAVEAAVERAERMDDIMRRFALEHARQIVMMASNGGKLSADEVDAIALLVHHGRAEMNGDIVTIKEPSNG